MENKGITIIALVIIIIVVLMLLSISMSPLIGENGILRQAKKEDIETEISALAKKINIITQEQNIAKEEGIDSRTTIDVMRENSYIYDNNVINIKEFMDTAKYGKGDAENYKNVYGISGNKIMYWNFGGKIEKEVTINLSNEAFITEWKVEAGDTIILPVGYDGWNSNFVVDWGDGSPTEIINDFEKNLLEQPSHKYTNAGNYQLSITGICKIFSLNSLENGESANKLLKIISWGETELSNCDFANAVNLESPIPTPEKATFKYMKSFKYLFSRCSNIKSIPSDLFANIPETVTSFANVFYRCESLEAIPEGLFDKAENATNFENAFFGCSNIEKIPENIFANNKKIVNLKSTFYHLDKITTAPKLWEQITTEELDATGCFSGCFALDKIGMPEAWYQIL